MTKKYTLQYDIDHNNTVENIWDLLDDSPEHRIYEWKKGLRPDGGGTTDPDFQDIIVMKGMKWTYDDINNLPEYMFLTIMRVLSLEYKQKLADMQR